MFWFIFSVALQSIKRGMFHKLETFTLRTAMKEQRCIRGTVVSLTSALDGDMWLTPSPGRFIL